MVFSNTNMFIPKSNVDSLIKSRRGKATPFAIQQIYTSNLRANIFQKWQTLWIQFVIADGLVGRPAYLGVAIRNMTSLAPHLGVAISVPFRVAI